MNNEKRIMMENSATQNLWIN